MKLQRSVRGSGGKNRSILFQFPIRPVPGTTASRKFQEKPDRSGESPAVTEYAGMRNKASTGFGSLCAGILNNPPKEKIPA